MPNIASLLKSEIARLARKELRAETDGMRKAIATYRTDIAALKKRVHILEKQLARATRPRRQLASGSSETSNDGEAQSQVAAGLRFRATGMAANRKRLGLSAADFGRLVGATGQSVYSWEAGKTKPKANNLTAIAALRGAGKREVAERLAALD